MSARNPAANRLDHDGYIITDTHDNIYRITTKANDALQ